MCINLAGFRSRTSIAFMYKESQCKMLFMCCSDYQPHQAPLVPASRASVMKGLEQAVISRWEVALFPCHHSEWEAKGST